MMAKFDHDQVILALKKREFSFVALALSYVLDGVSLSDNEFANILGMTREEAERMRSNLRASEQAARALGDHWNPTRPSE